MNLSYASFSLKDPRDLNFALRALLGSSHENAPDACHAIAARLPPAPTVAEVVEIVFAERVLAVDFLPDRDRAVSVLAAYFSIDPPVEPDPLS